MNINELTDDEFYTKIIKFSLIGLVLVFVVFGARIFYVTRPSYRKKFDESKTVTSSTSNNPTGTGTNTLSTQNTKISTGNINSLLKGSNSINFAYGVLEELNSYSFANGGNDMYVESLRQVTRNVISHKVEIHNIQDKLTQNNVTTVKGLSSLVSKELLNNREIVTMLLNRRNLGITMDYSLLRNNLICNIRISHT